MAGLADLLYLGQPDPARQLAMALAGRQQPQPPQGGPPPGPAPGPPGPAPGPVDPNAPAPNAQPVSADPSAAPNPAPGAPPPPGSPPQPQALQSTPDMSASYATLANPPNIMSLYMQMQQRQQASDQINRGLALIAANHSAPSMRQSIMESLTGGGQDAGQQVGNLMSLYQTQQQMGATQDMLAHASDYDTKLGLPPGTARDMILAGKGPDLIAKMEPTDTQRNIQFEHDQFIKGGGTEEDWKNNYLPMIITGGLPGMTGDMKSMAFARTQWNNDPANKGRPMPGYLTDPTKWGIYTKDLGDAKQQFNGMNQALDSFVNNAGDIAADPELANITGSTANAFKARNAFSGTAAYDLTSKMKQLGADAKAMGSRGGPKGVGQNLATLGSNPDAFTDYGITNYGEDQIAPKIRTALQAQANAFGAAGQLAAMPHYLDQYLDPMYKPGGDLDPGGGTKPFTPSKDPNLQQPTPQDIETFKHNLEHFGPKRALAQLKADHIDTSSLE
jgi:hypothetical protein